jgi:hypothetical protein
VEQRFWKVFRDFLVISLVAFLIFWGGSLLLQSYTIAVVTGYLLSFLFVGSNFWVIQKIKKTDVSKFYWQFFISLGIRFTLVIVVLIMILRTTEIHEIYFTVSFIISYILHSVIEIISINKILESDN